MTYECHEYCDTCKLCLMGESGRCRWDPVKKCGIVTEEGEE